MTTSSSGELEFWQRRLEAVSRAQGRYLFMLALAGLFYYALELHVTDLGATPNPLELPVVSVEVSSVTVWLSGPIAIGVLLLAVLGTFHAVEVATRQCRRAAGLEETGHGLPEHFDVAFNIIDAVVYTSDKSPRAAQWVLRMTYPVILTVFWLEAATFLIVAFAFTPPDLFPQLRFPGWQEASALVFRALGVVAVLLPLPRLWSLWRAKLATAGRR